MNLNDFFYFKDDNLYWKIDYNNYSKDTVVGFSSGQYTCIRIDAVLYKVHRIIYELNFWKIPEGFEIDHINRNKKDNRLANLRLVTRSLNEANKGVRKTSKSGFKGVHFENSCKKWRAKIQKDGNRFHIGDFNFIKDAVIAYNNTAKQLFGEFAYQNEVPE